MRLRLAAPLALLAVLAAAGCGTGGLAEQGKGDKTAGKQMFTQKCGSCHALADAGTKGAIGPNLDDAFRGARHDGFEESTIFEVVDKQIEYPIPPMPGPHTLFPDDKTRAEDIDSVADYVASVAGKPLAPGAGGGTTTQPAGGGNPMEVGKQVFQSAGCSGCHTLKDAGATGTVGPNLDQAKPPKALVIDRVTNGKGAMPSFKGQLSDAQIQAVATYVSTIAGK